MKSSLIAMIALSSITLCADNVYYYQTPVMQERPLYTMRYNCSVYATHYLIGTGANGVIELEDGSQWKLNGYDAYAVMSWAFQDPIMITPNDNWLSFGGGYHVTNLRTGSYVRAFLYQGAHVNSPFRNTLSGIDYTSGSLILENGLQWSLSSSDYETFKKWIVGDPIIVGSYSSFMSSYDHILINVGTNTFVHAKLN